MALTLKEVEHIAKLARLGLAGGEKGVLKKELSSILNYVSKLQEVDVKKIEPTSQVTGLVNTMREDKVEEFDEKIFDGQLKVKKVFDN